MFRLPLSKHPRRDLLLQRQRYKLADDACELVSVKDGKHLPKAKSKRGDPFRRILRVKSAQTRLRSLRTKPSHD